MEIKKINLTEENLTKIERIDDLFYSSDITGLGWYTERYKPEHTGIALLDGDNLVGYMVAVPIREELYNTIKSGCVLNDVAFNPEMYVGESDYYYVASAVILEEYRGQKHAWKMLDMLFSGLQEKNCVALVVSHGGEKLAQKYMTQHKRLPHDKSIYIKEI